MTNAVAPVDLEPSLPELRDRGHAVDTSRTLGHVGTEGVVNDEVVSTKSAFRAFSKRRRRSEAFSDAARIATIATSPRPIISAEAVEAVRRGFRIAFSRPSLPWMPQRRIGAPITRRERAAPSGDRIATPTNVAAAPSPIERAGVRLVAEQPVQQRGNADRGDDQPDDQPAIAAMPPRACPPTPGAPATGATRAARRAGRIDDSDRDDRARRRTQTTIVRGSSWSDVLGRSIPNAESSPFSPSGDRDPGDEAERRRDEADQERLDHHRRQHLPSARTDRPQQRQLPRALRHDDRERVEDDERARRTAR